MDTNLNVYFKKSLESKNKGYKPFELYQSDLIGLCDIQLDKEPVVEGFTRDLYGGWMVIKDYRIRGLFMVFHGGNIRVESLEDCPEDIQMEIASRQRKRWFPASFRLLIRYIYQMSAVPLGCMVNWQLYKGNIRGVLILFCVMLCLRRIYTETRNRI